MEVRKKRIFSCSQTRQPLSLSSPATSDSSKNCPNLLLFSFALLLTPPSIWYSTFAMDFLLPIPRFFPLFFFFLSILLRFSSPSEPSFYDYLRESGLPAGIVPKGVTDFSVDPKTGRFTVTLPGPCEAQFENQFHFDFNITGVLSDGRIGNLSGVTQKELFLWFPVKGIRVDPDSSGLIHFDVGVVDKRLSLSLFESPRDCTAVNYRVRPVYFEKSDGSPNHSREIWSTSDRGNGQRAIS